MRRLMGKMGCVCARVCVGGRLLPKSSGTRGPKTVKRGEGNCGCVGGSPFLSFEKRKKVVKKPLASGRWVSRGIGVACGWWGRGRPGAAALCRLPRHSSSPPRPHKMAVSQSGLVTHTRGRAEWVGRAEMRDRSAMCCRERACRVTRHLPAHTRGARRLGHVRGTRALARPDCSRPREAHRLETQVTRMATVRTKGAWHYTAWTERTGSFPATHPPSPPPSSSSPPRPVSAGGPPGGARVRVPQPLREEGVGRASLATFLPPS